MRTKEIEIAENTYEVEYAGTPFSQFLGMRGRKDGKMLFRFPAERRWRIDMAGVLTELHLYFMDNNGEVVDVQEARPWSLHPMSWGFERPSEPAKFLLESSKPLPITKGDVLEVK